MFCKNCGKGNPDNSNFCEHCGIKFGKAHIEEENAPRTSHEAEKHSRSEEIDSDTSPYPYVISVTKLIVLSVATFGLFEVYWFYKQWKSIRAEEDINVTPILRAIFATFTSYWLFKHISEMVKKVGKKRGLESGGLAIVYFILVATYKLPDPYWWVAILTFLPLIPAQNAINYYWEKKLGDRLITSGFGLWNYIWTFAGVVFLILALYGTFGSFEDLTSSTDPTTSTTTQTLPSTNLSSQNTSGLGLEETYGQNFMTSCNTDGTLQEGCACILSYLRSNYSLSERIKMDSQYEQTNELPQAMYDAIDYCK